MALEYISQVIYYSPFSSFWSLKVPVLVYLHYMEKGQDILQFHLLCKLTYLKQCERISGNKKWYSWRVSVLQSSAPTYLPEVHSNPKDLY